MARPAKMVQLNVLVPNPLKERLTHAARMDGRTLAAYVRLILARSLTMQAAKETRR